MSDKCRECTSGSLKVSSNEYLSDELVKERKVKLIGVKVFTCDNCHEQVVQFPCLGPLLRLMEAETDKNQFIFNANERKWVVGE